MTKLIIEPTKGFEFCVKLFDKNYARKSLNPNLSKFLEKMPCLMT